MYETDAFTADNCHDRLKTLINLARSKPPTGNDADHVLNRALRVAASLEEAEGIRQPPPQRSYSELMPRGAGEGEGGEEEEEVELDLSGDSCGDDKVRASRSRLGAGPGAGARAPQTEMGRFAGDKKEAPRQAAGKADASAKGAVSKQKVRELRLLSRV